MSPPPLNMVSPMWCPACKLKARDAEMSFWCLQCASQVEAGGSVLGPCLYWVAGPLHLTRWRTLPWVNNSQQSWVLGGWGPQHRPIFAHTPKVYGGPLHGELIKASHHALLQSGLWVAWLIITESVHHVCGWGTLYFCAAGRPNLQTDFHFGMGPDIRHRGPI